MKRSASAMIGLFGAALLAGCNVASVDRASNGERRLGEYRMERPAVYGALTRDEFKRAKQNHYGELAENEWRRADSIDAVAFADRGTKSRRWRAVHPDDLNERNLSPSHAEELALARRRLIAAMAEDGWFYNPGLAARAQAAFDCWVAEQEENAHSAAIVRCREDFFESMEQLETVVDGQQSTTRVSSLQAMAASPVPADPPASAAQSTTFKVFFAFNSARLDEGSRQMIRRAARQARQGGTVRVVIEGNADRAGPETYNQGLSERRAEVVRNMIIAEGVDPRTISSVGYGETRPAVPTPDGVAKAENRRAEILIR